MSRSFAELLPTPLTAESLALLQPLGRAEDLLLLLERWVERGWLRALDKAFVAFLHERDPQGDPLVLLAAALTSHQLGHGHVCLDLFETLKEPDFALSLPPEGDVQTGAMLLPSQLLEALDGEAWCKALQASPLAGVVEARLHPAMAEELGVAGRERVRVSQNGGATVELPLVLDASVPRGCVWIPASLPDSVALGPAVGPVVLQ